MLQIEKVRAALTAVEECCGHCDICSPSCPIFIAKRALSSLHSDLEAEEEANK